MYKIKKEILSCSLKGLENPCFGESRQGRDMFNVWCVCTSIDFPPNRGPSAKSPPPDVELAAVAENSRKHIYTEPPPEREFPSDAKFTQFRIYIRSRIQKPWVEPSRRRRRWWWSSQRFSRFFFVLLSFVNWKASLTHTGGIPSRGGIKKSTRVQDKTKSRGAKMKKNDMDRKGIILPLSWNVNPSVMQGW